MNSQKTASKKKSLVKSILSILAFALLGAFLGYFLGYFSNHSFALMPALTHGLQIASIWLLLAVLLFNGTALLLYYKSVHFSKNAPHDDSCFEQSNRLLFFCMALTSISVVWSIMFSGVAISFLFNSEQIFAGLLITAFLIFEIIFTSTLQSKSVCVAKKLAPEKKGNMMDSNFQKDWYNSCDEAEQKAIGDYSYFTFRIMNTVYPILLSLIILSSITYSPNPFLIILIGGLWMLHNASYLGRSFWIEYRKK